MALETADAFALMATAYRMGLLDKALPLVGLAINGCKYETGLDYGDILVQVDEARKETIEKLDRVFGRLGFLLRLASNERFLGFCTRLFDSELVKRATVWSLQRLLVKVVGGNGERLPLSERLRGRRAGPATNEPIPLGKRS